MLTSFFGKSKPINFIIVGIYLILGWFYSSLIVLDNFSILSFFRTHTFLLLIILFSVLLLNFIVKKNKLTENNTYTILFFASFMLIMPLSFFHSDVIISNVLLWLAFRRILSLNSEINMEKKILDASIWITIATLFYFWCILFFIVLFISVFQRRSKNYKLILIPFVGFSSVIIIITAFKLVLNKSFLWFLDINTDFSLDLKEYDSLSLIIPITFLVLLMFWTLIQKLIHFSEIRLKDKSNSFLLIMILLISGIVILLIPNKNGSEFLYLMAPLAIFTTNFIDKTTLFWVKELFLWVVVLFPVFVVFL